MAKSQILMGYLLAPLAIPTTYFFLLLFIYRGAFGGVGEAMFSLIFYPFGLFILLLGNFIVGRRAVTATKRGATLLFAVIGFASGLGYQLLIRGNGLNDALLSSLFLMFGSCLMYVVYRRLISFRASM